MAFPHLPFRLGRVSSWPNFIPSLLTLLITLPCLPQGPCHIKLYYGHINSRRWWQKKTTVVKQYGRVSETPCFLGKSHRRSPQLVNYYGDSKSIRRSFFNTAGSFGCVVAADVHLRTPANWLLRHQQADASLVLRGLRPLVAASGMNLGKRKHTPPCSSEEFFFAEKMGAKGGAKRTFPQGGVNRTANSSLETAQT